MTVHYALNHGTTMIQSELKKWCAWSALSPSKDDVLEGLLLAIGDNDVTFHSLLEYLQEKAPASQEEINQIKQQLQENRLSKKDFKLYGLSSLDTYQDEVMRMPVQGAIILDGLPGSGKTTTAIKLLTKHCFYDENGDRLPQHLPWLYIVPNEILKDYIQEAFNREGIPATSDSIVTWHPICKHLLRDVFEITNIQHPYQIVEQNINNSEDPLEKFNQLKDEVNFTGWQESVHAFWQKWTKQEEKRTTFLHNNETLIKNNAAILGIPVSLLQQSITSVSTVPQNRIPQWPSYLEINNLADKLYKANEVDLYQSALNEESIDQLLSKIKPLFMAYYEKNIHSRAMEFAAKWNFLVLEQDKVSPQDFEQFWQMTAEWVYTVALLGAAKKALNSRVWKIQDKIRNLNIRRSKLQNRYNRAQLRERDLLTLIQQATPDTIHLLQNELQSVRRELQDIPLEIEKLSANIESQTHSLVPLDNLLNNIKKIDNETLKIAGCRYQQQLPSIFPVLAEKLFTSKFTDLQTQFTSLADAILPATSTDSKKFNEYKKDLVEFLCDDTHAIGKSEIEFVDSSDFLILWLSAFSDTMRVQRNSMAITKRHLFDDVARELHIPSVTCYMLPALLLVWILKNLWHNELGNAPVENYYPYEELLAKVKTFLQHYAPTYQLDSLTADAIALLLLQAVDTLRDNHFSRKYSKLLEKVKRYYKIIVDEVTDFSPVQIKALSLLSPNGLLMCGDLMQRTTKFGTTNWKQLENIGFPHHAELTIGYRQNPNLLAVANELYNFVNHTHKVFKSAFPSGNYPTPFYTGDLTFEQAITFLKKKLSTIYRQEHSIAIFVPNETTRHQYYLALKQCLPFLDFRECENGQTGSQNEIRIVTYDSIKGLEFEETFLVGLDKLDVDLCDKFIYLALTRATRNLYIIGSLPVVLRHAGNAMKYFQQVVE